MKNLLKRLLSALAFIACMTSAIAQINYGGQPSYMVNSESINNSKIVLPAIDREALAAEDEVTDKIKEVPWRFGVENNVNITR